MVPGKDRGKLMELQGEKDKIDAKIVKLYVDMEKQLELL